MTYDDILNSNLLHLPIAPGVSYKSTITEILYEFLQMVKSLDGQELDIEDLKIDPEFIKNAQAPFIEGLLKVIDLYYDGKPAAAFETLKSTMVGSQKDFSKILKIETYKENESFFRIRLSEENFPMSSSEMFHIPFELRERVSTKRYSIPGFPSLYLGRTVYGCWEEMNRPNIHHFQAVKLTSTRKINYLDLTRPLYTNNLLTKHIYHYFMTWPLIACCSLKVNDYSSSFIPEYIIPQLLLQWVRENGKIDGIRYNSTHIDLHNSKSSGDFSNLVLPVKQTQDYGFCPKLARMFQMTQSISWQLMENATGGQVFIYGGEPETNRRISRLEIIKGHAYPYNYSILGSIENYLDGMQLEPIPFST